MTILVSGFGPFLNHKTNPTKELLNRLPKTLMGHTIKTVEVPVAYDVCFDVLQPYIEQETPDMILMLGLAATSQTIRLERVAINISDSKHPDNTGRIETDQPILCDGENAYFSSLPIQVLKAKLKENGYPVSISNSAGLYVCNNLFYHVMHYIEINRVPVQAGFIHVPPTPESGSSDERFTVPLDTLVDAVTLLIDTLITEKE